MTSQNIVAAIMVMRAVAFDFGHTLIDEQKDGNVPLESHPIHLMAEISEVLTYISLPLAVWPIHAWLPKPNFAGGLRGPPPGDSLHGWLRH